MVVAFLATAAGQTVTTQAAAQPVDYSSLVDDRTITIASAEDVAAKRRELIAFIWGAEGFPSAKQPSVDIGIPSPLADLQNLRAVNRLRFALDNGEENMAYQFVPRVQNRKVVIVHQGHACSLDDRVADPSVRDGVYGTIKALLADGYTVLAMFMPRHTPADCRPYGVHDEMFDVALPTGNAVKFFLEPTAVALNYLKAQGYTDFSMTGLSGGGWTTTLYAAIDPTIRQSFPVAGSIPLYLRPQSALAGDTEQVLPELYRIAGYLDLYVMGAAGHNRRQVQILNRRDDCCFGERQHTGVDGLWHDALRRYEIKTRLALETTGLGSFRVEIDDAAAFHSISHHGAVNVILAELQGSLPEVAAANATEAYVRGANGNLWQRTASRWLDTGLPMTGVPTVVDDSEHPVDVFYRDPNNGLRRAYVSGDAWVSASVGGSPLLNDPVATVGSDGRWDVFISTVDVRLYRWYWRAPWSFVGNERLSETARIHGLPASVSPALDSYNVFFRGWDDAVWEVGKASGTAWSLERVGDAGGRVSGYPSAALVDAKARVYVHASTAGEATISSAMGARSADSDGTPTADAKQRTGGPGKERAAGGAARPSVAAADTVAPTVSLTFPAEGAILSGAVNITADASDNVGVARTEMWIDGVAALRDTSSPYVMKWMTKKVADGPHTLRATAVDRAGNAGSSASVTVTVRNASAPPPPPPPPADTTAPIVNVTSPASETTVAGVVEVTANAQDDVGVTSVEFMVDGAVRSNDTSSPYSFTWDTTSVADGSRTLAAKAYDAAGNTAVAEPVSVLVANEAPPEPPAQSQLYEAVRGGDGAWAWTALPLPAGTILAGSPAATLVGGSPSVFSRTSSHGLSAFTLSEGSWQFADKGGQIAGTPTVVPGGVWARGLNGDLQFFDGTSWSARGAPAAGSG